jgi:TRAP-type C4-dicarboxylate transport system permease small subunit
MIEKTFAVLDRVLLIIASVAIFVMLAITTVSVIGRHFFNAPIPDDLVFNELLIVVLVFLPFAYVQSTDQHVFVTLFTDWLPPRKQAYFKFLGNLIGLMIFCLIAYATWLDFMESFEVRAYSEGVLELPEYPSRFAVFFGVLVMTLRLAFDTIRGLLSFSNNEVEA